MSFRDRFIAAHGRLNGEVVTSHHQEKTDVMMDLMDVIEPLDLRDVRIIDEQAEPRDGWVIDVHAGVEEIREQDARLAEMQRRADDAADEGLVMVDAIRLREAALETAEAHELIDGSEDAIVQRHAAERALQRVRDEHRRAADPWQSFGLRRHASSKNSLPSLGGE